MTTPEDLGKLVKRLESPWKLRVQATVRVLHRYLGATAFEELRHSTLAMVFEE